MRPDSRAQPVEAPTSPAADVLVVGAGPTGLALACDLLRRGVRVTVIDRADGPARTSRAFGLQPGGLEQLEALGAADDLARRAVTALASVVHVGRRELGRVALGGIADAGHPGIYLISQAEVEAALRARLVELGGSVAWRHELVELRDEGGVVRATVEGPAGREERRAAWVVGCDGAHSTVRRAAGIAFQGEAFPQSFLLADVSLDWGRSRLAAVSWLHPEGILGALPLPGDDRWRVMAEIPDGVEVADDAAAVELVHALLRERADDSATRVVDTLWTSRFRIHRRLAASYRRGRVLLAGDAAHIHSPMGGQGMNTGLGDAVNLAWKLALVSKGRAPHRLLDTYEAERRPVARDVVSATSAGTRLLLSRSPLLRLLRDRVVLPLLQVPAVQRRASAQISQLDLTYRGGPLAPARAPLVGRLRRLRRRPRPGDRAPDAPCLVWPAGTRSSLLAAAGGHWTLLLFTPPSARERDWTATVRARLGPDVRVMRVVPSALLPVPGRWSGTVVEDHRDVARRRYRPAAGEAVLLRPDGHVAWRSGEVTEPLAAWLDRVAAAAPHEPQGPQGHDSDPRSAAGELVGSSGGGVGKPMQRR